MKTKLRKPSKRASLRNPPEWLYEAMAGAKTTSGQAVNEHTVLNLAAVWACVRVVSQTIGSIPWHVYRKDGDSRYQAPQHELSRLLHLRPNPDMTAMAFKIAIVQRSLLTGNGYAEIVRDDTDRIVALYPITRPVTIRRLPNKQLAFDVEQEGSSPPITLTADRVYHLPNFPPDGIAGRSAIQFGRESLGLSIAAEKLGASFFGNGAHMGGVLEHPGQLGEKAQQNLRSSINAAHQGANNAGKFMILEEGMKYNRTAIPPEDAQFLETRQFQVEEICRWFNVPPHKVQHLLRSTFSNIEHQSIEFVRDTIRPWLVQMEQEADYKLVRPSEQETIYTKHNADAVMRGDSLSRSQAFEIQLRNGVLLPDEWRAYEERNPLADGIGQRPLVTVNTVPLDKLDAQLDAKAAPSEPATPAEEMVRKHLDHLRETRGEAFAAAESARLAKLLTENLDGTA